MFHCLRNKTGEETTFFYYSGVFSPYLPHFHCCNIFTVPTTVLTSACIEKLVGKDVLTSNAYKLTNFLAQQEDRFKICVYVCDMDFSPWTQQCLRQADCILIVGRGTSEPTMGQVRPYFPFANFSSSEGRFPSFGLIPLFPSYLFPHPWHKHCFYGRYLYHLHVICHAEGRGFDT